MLKSSKKILLCSGDSFTRGHAWFSGSSIKINLKHVWPDVLAEKLNMKCVNLGRGNSNNEMIHNEIIDRLCHPKDIGLAICMWSLFKRHENEFTNVVKKSLRYFHSFQTYCEHNNVDYLQVQAYPPTNFLSKEFLDIPQFDFINSKTFLGWPIYEELGGYQISTKLLELDPDQTKLHIGNGDNHPNDKGHDWIADFLYEKYKEVYQ